MRVRRVRRYRKAKYPRGAYRRKQANPARAAARGGATSLLIMALTEGCDITGIGTTGPPPVDPNFVTENEARLFIDHLFQEAGVELQADYPLVFRWAQDSLAFQVDGFNEALNVGYEYVAVDDTEAWMFTQEARSALNAASDADGPYVELVGATEDHPGWEEALESQVTAFLDQLRAMGII